MNPVQDKTFNRRSFVAGTGSLVVGFSLAGSLAGQAAAHAAVSGTPDYWPIPSGNAVDSFLQINADGTVVAKFGKGTAAQGTTTGVLQMYAEELDLPVDSITMIVGDTALTPNQTGASGSNGISTEWTTVRQAAATAKQQLLALASTRLGVPIANLTVSNGVVTGGGQSVTYGNLIGGQQFNLAISATAPQTPTSQFRVIGTSVQRREIPRIVVGQESYAHDVRLPGMLHARNIRPALAGSTLVKVGSADHLPGDVKVVSKGNYVAVVAKTEWQAIQAAHALDVTWQPPSVPPYPNGYPDFFNYVTSVPIAAGNQSVSSTGNTAAALAAAAKTVSATYQIDFQTHSTMGPFCAVADYNPAGSCVIYMGGQKPYGQQTAVADMLSKLINPNVTPNNVRIIWYPGASSMGRSEADDVSMEAAFLSATVGAPVRVQWSRQESTAWTPVGPGGVISVQAGLDATNKVTAWKWTSWTTSGSQIPAGAAKLGDTLLGNLVGYTPTYATEYMTNAGYGFPNTLVTANNVPWNQTMGSQLRSAHLRAPQAPQTAFASEQFEDEIAYAAGLDPVNFRLTYSAARPARALQMAAQAAGWVSRPSPSPASATKARHVVGRGAGIVGNIAQIAEVEVDRKTGTIRVLKVTTGHDSGFVINPLQVTMAIQAGNMHAINRAIRERVMFNSTTVTSDDWESYPILTLADTPEMNAVLVGANGIDPSGSFNNPSGAGEPMQAPLVGAIANAVFDATGVRVRRMPMTSDVVLASLQAAGKDA